MFALRIRKIPSCIRASPKFKAFSFISPSLRSEPFLSAMSYILEALKKSQHERELGQAPPLATPSFPIEKAGTRLNLWVLLALVLAVSAVVIALYSALRGDPDRPDGSP